MSDKLKIDYGDTGGPGYFPRPTIRRPNSPIEAMIDQATGADKFYAKPMPIPGGLSMTAEMERQTAVLLAVVDAAQAWKRDRNRPAKRAQVEERLAEAVRAWERLGG